MPLKLENASKRVGNRWVYREVTFEVADGEVFGIFGASGSGKSEIIRSFDDGVANRQGVPLIKRIFGITRKSSDRADELEATIEKAVGPRILEYPFVGFDNLRKEAIAAKLREKAKEENIPVLFCTADFNTILLAADRAAAFIDGYIRQIGTPRELYEEPRTRAVAVLTGRHNLIEARRLTSSKSQMPEFQTILGNHRLFTQKAEIKALGPINQNTWLAIRPEQISLAFGASFPEDNLLRCVITGSRFLGPHTLVQLESEGLQLQATVPRLVGLNPGDECMAALPPDRIRILTD